jgi:hypothetical protein
MGWPETGTERLESGGMRDGDAAEYWRLVGEAWEREKAADRMAREAWEFRQRAEKLLDRMGEGEGAA